MDKDSFDIQQFIASSNENNDEHLTDLLKKCYDYMKTKEDLKENEYSRALTEITSRFYPQCTDKSSTDLVLTKWKNWLSWYIKIHPEQLKKSDISTEMKKGIIFIHGKDKEDRPCIVIRQALHTPSTANIEELIKVGYYEIERALKLAESTKNKNIVIIMDRVGFGWSNVDRRLIGNSMVLGLSQEYYMEKIFRMYVYPVNWLFQKFMALVKPFLNKETANKLVYCNSECELKQYFTEENLIKELGGTSTYEYTYTEEEESN